MDRASVQCWYCDGMDGTMSVTWEKAVLPASLIWRDMRASFSPFLPLPVPLRIVCSREGYSTLSLPGSFSQEIGVFSFH